MKKGKIILLIILLSSIMSKSQNYFSNEISSKTSVDQQPSDTIIELSHPEIKFRIALGPGHWVSDRFRTTSTFTKDWGLGIGFHPGLEYLQILARFDYSFIRTTENEITYAALNEKFIGFSSLSVALCKNARFPNSHELTASYFIGGVMVSVQDYINTAGILSGFGIDYIMRNPSWKNFGIGISMNMRYQTYNITDEKAWHSFLSTDRQNLDVDLNYNLGVVIVF
jgi:hypothetical protein